MLDSTSTKTIELEYVWFTDSVPRSKTRIIEVDDVKDFISAEMWKSYKTTFDGSSTLSVDTTDLNTDVYLNPVRLYRSHTKDPNHFFLLCECIGVNNIPEKSNFRSGLTKIYNNNEHEVMIGFE